MSIDVATRTNCHERVFIFAFDSGMGYRTLWRSKTNGIAWLDVKEAQGTVAQGRIATNADLV